MYIITNSTMGGEYTPSKANTLEGAKEWMKECTVNNIRNSGIDESLFDMSNEEVLEWGEENLDMEYGELYSKIWYDDDSYNIMHIYNLDEI